MYFIEMGMHKRFRFLAYMFAGCTAMASLFIGNMVQANSVAHALNTSLGLPEWVTGAVLFLIVGVVLLGGVQRIAAVAGRLVPVMPAPFPRPSP